MSVSETGHNRLLQALDASSVPTKAFQPRACSSQSPPRSGSCRTLSAVCGLLVLAVAVAFGPTVRHEFVNYDDEEYVYRNPHVTAGITTGGIVWALTGSDIHNWHPLTWLSHMLDWQFYGPKPGGHHLTSVVLHAATAVLLFLVLRQMTGDLWPSAFAAAVFAIHPLRVQSVAWVAERKDVLSGLFFMLTLASYARYARGPFSWLRYLTVVLVFALGLMAKPMLVTLPLVLLLLDYWPLRRIGAGSREQRARGGEQEATPHSPLPDSHSLLYLILEKVPLLALSAASCAVTLVAQRDAIVPGQHSSLASRTANAVVACAAYVGQLFYPAGLAAYYPRPEGGLPAWKVSVAAAMLASISAGCFVLRHKHRYLLAGWLWYLVMLVPVIGLVQVGSHAMADRYTYLPHIGLSLLATWWLAGLCASGGGRRGMLGAAIAALALAALIVCARIQTAYWRDSESLWTRAIACTSHNGVAQFNLASVLYEKGRVDEAVTHFEEGLKVFPGDAQAHLKLGNALFSKGQPAEAITHYQKALETKPGDTEIHNELGNVLARQGRFAEAVEQYQAVLRIDSGSAGTCANLAIALAALSQYDSALATFRHALKIDPDTVEACNGLAWLLATCPDTRLRNGAEAVELAERAVRVGGDQDPELLDTLAAAYAEAGRFPQAVETAERAVALAAARASGSPSDEMRARLDLYRAGRPYHKMPRP